MANYSVYRIPVLQVVNHGKAVCKYGVVGCHGFSMGLPSAMSAFAPEKEARRGNTRPCRLLMNTPPLYVFGMLF